MERDRKAYNDDAKLVQLMKTQVSEHGDLSRLNARLLDENKVLRYIAIKTYKPCTNWYNSGKLVAMLSY